MTFRQTIVSNAPKTLNLATFKKCLYETTTSPGLVKEAHVESSLLNYRPHVDLGDILINNCCLGRSFRQN